MIEKRKWIEWWAIGDKVFDQTTPDEWAGDYKTYNHDITER